MRIEIDGRPDGLVSETTIANIGFFDGDTVVWPDAPCLPGITMLLLQSRLPSCRRPVRLSDVPRFAGAFLSNSWGVYPVGKIDGVLLPGDSTLLKTVTETYESVPWDTI